jgi:glycerol-3-phosphate dehydrogenase
VSEGDFDLAIVGGGVNGCGIARDAAGRGLSVVLCEQGDLGGGTSSASTKLIHGGLRYLEFYEFRLVREALVEREVLLRAAPHIIWPMRFVLPYHSGLRPAWLIRLGLFLYDSLGGRRILPPTRAVDLRRDEAGRPLTGAYSRGFEYSDCWVDDSRLVVLNAVDAGTRGASINVRTRCVAADRGADGWRLTLEDTRDGSTRTVGARVLVNATGPWLEEFLTRSLRVNALEQVRLVKGSHIVTRRLFDHDKAYIFQNSDGRVVFAIPYECDFTLIGTTDVDYTGDPTDAAITEGEIDYLCSAVNGYFEQPVGRDAIVHTYSGVRPLFDDGSREAQAATRDYVLKLDAADDKAPLLNIFGGKITTYRRLAEAALQRLAPYFPAMSGPWTADASLPGGAFAVDGFGAEVARLRASSPALDEPFATRLIRAYGTGAHDFAAGARSLEDLGRCFGATLHEREVAYLMDREWARTARDVLWRRSKLGLRLTGDEAAALDEWMERRRVSTPAPAPAA